MFKKYTTLLMMAMLVFSACSDDSDDPMPNDNNDNTTDNSIVGVAEANGSFTILLDALERTDLTATLSGEGSFTVFAPTDEAFGKVLEANNMTTLDELESALTTEGLKNVLLYHVLGAEVSSADVSTGFVSSLATRGSNADQTLSMFLDATSGVRINDTADVVQADVEADNGVIHVINEVILPLNIVELASLSPDHGSLVGALVAADGDLVSVLSGDGPFTVFAPTDMAFAAVQSTVETLSTAQLATVLTYHVVEGNIRANDVTAGMVTTVAQQDITIATDNGVTITDVNSNTSTVVATDIQGTNGVIHVIDGVLIPAL